MRVFIAFVVSVMLLGCRSKESVYGDGQGASRPGVSPAAVVSLCTTMTQVCSRS